MHPLQRYTLGMNRYIHIALIAVALLSHPAAGEEPAATDRPFQIRIVDEQTGRGVPLVELRTVNGVRCYSDSAGNVAFSEPGLMGSKVFFFLTSHGYEFPKDAFGMVGAAVETAPGGSATLRIKRLNIAERLYRVTGEGIYRDTVLLGQPAPIRQPLLNAQVAGQDSVQALPYRGKLYWFWGDTGRMSYPLGQFQTSGATSQPPADGGLAPSVGVDLEYFAGPDGFSRRMCPMERGGEPILVWLDGLLTAPDESGGERLVARYAQMKSLEKMLEHGLVVFNDQTQTFEKIAQLELAEQWRFPRGQAVRYSDGGKEYYLFPAPYPVTRVAAALEQIKDPAAYEAFTPLQAGQRYSPEAVVERDAAGKAVWGWKRDTDPISPRQERELIAAGKLQPGEARFQLTDADGGGPVELHGGSFHPNAHLGKWIMIGVQAGGKSSFLGEVWFAAADGPTGPWTTAVKIATHDRYSFYNPTQHVFFDEEGGRVVYFEGTYAETFSGAPFATPRYDYNQVMYRLDLADPRLAPPAAQSQPTTTTTAPAEGD